MKRPRIFWKLFPSYLWVIALCLVCSWLVLRFELANYEKDRNITDLQELSQVFIVGARPYLSPLNLEKLEQLCREAGEASSTRITLVANDGTVLADSLGDPASMENHSGRPEIQDALNHGMGYSERQSPTLGRSLVYVAVKATTAEGVQLLVRSSQPLKESNARLGRAASEFAVLLGIIAVLSALLGLFVSRRLSRPLERLRSAVEVIGSGNLEVRLPIPDIEEPAQVAMAINSMSSDLSRHIQTIMLQQSRQQAILLGMGAGVLAVDRKQRVIFANQAMEELLGAAGKTLSGRHVLEITGNADLQEFIEKAQGKEESLEAEIIWSLGEDRYFQARSAPLRDAAGGNDGTLLVLSEITKLRKLDLARRDFAANASHELRTPITSIRGFAETLRHSEHCDTERRNRFLDIILRQTGRLEALIEDLLLIASLESLEERMNGLEYMPVRPVLEASLQTCRPVAANKEMELELDCENGLVAKINSEVLERAVTNLVDNAVKYCPKGTPVKVSAKSENSWLLISVSDRGPGISAAHQKRIFERFYRVDISRSRSEGGTGLGLAIVKHAALAHGGGVSLASAPGAGCVFTLKLPQG